MPSDPVQVVRNRLRSDYPRPDLNPEWLSQCVSALQESEPQATIPDLIHFTETQLLLSHLSASCLSNNSGLPEAPPDGSYPHDVILFGPAKKDMCLVMITAITEVGSSAFQLRTVKEQRAEALSGAAKIRRLRVRGMEGEGDGGGEEEEEEEDDIKEGDIPPYPRGMLMLEVSDGHRLMRAMEYKRIDGLKLGDTALGSKMLLRNVRCLRGTLLLTPDSVILKGHMVEELEELQGHMFENGLRARLGNPLLPLPGVEGETEDAAAPLAIEVPVYQPPPPPPSRARAPRPGPPPPQSQPRAPPRNNQPIGRIPQHINDDDIDDSFDMDEELLAAVVDQASMIPANNRGQSRGPGPGQGRQQQSTSHRQSKRSHVGDYQPSTDPFDFPEPDEEELQAVMALERTQGSGSGGGGRRSGEEIAAMEIDGNDNGNSDSENGEFDGMEMEWNALDEIEQEQIRAAHFPNYRQSTDPHQSGPSRTRYTIPANLSRALPGVTMPKARIPTPASRSGNKGADLSSEAGTSTLGEESRFFAAGSSKRKGKGENLDEMDVETEAGPSRIGNKNTQAPRWKRTGNDWVEVDSDKEDDGPRRSGGKQSNVKGKRIISTVVLSDDDDDDAMEGLQHQEDMDNQRRDDGVYDDDEPGGADTSEDSQKENKIPPKPKPKAKPNLKPETTTTSSSSSSKAKSRQDRLDPKPRTKRTSLGSKAKRLPVASNKRKSGIASGTEEEEVIEVLDSD